MPLPSAATANRPFRDTYTNWEAHKSASSAFGDIGSLWSELETGQPDTVPGMGARYGGAVVTPSMRRDMDYLDLRDGEIEHDYRF